MSDLFSKEESMFYNCNMCKKTFNGEPALANGIGRMNKFCPDCLKEIRARVKASHDKKIPDDTCIWCLKSTKGDPTVDGGVHADCIRLRDEVLNSVRTSPQMAIYVSRIEKRDGPTRDERISSLAKKHDNIQDITRLENQIYEMMRQIDVMKAGRK